MDSLQYTIQPFFWTLIHSIWQGVFLAMAAGLVILLTKRSSIHLRYNLLITVSILFLLVVSYTFYSQLHINTPVTESSAAILKPHENSNPVLVNIMQQQRNGMLQTVTGFLNQHSFTIMLIWGLIFLYKLIRSVSDLYSISAIKKSGRLIQETSLLDKVQYFKSRLDIKYPVKVIESALVHSPAVIGVFKPVIVLPIGLMAHIPMDQVEHILIHELAHIKRRDYLFNLIQHFAESIFFFNPCVRWVSNLIKTEREHCCDDMAISITQNKSGFIQALVSYQEYQWKAVPLAMPFGAEKKPVLDRVKRIVFNHNKTLNNMEKTFLSLGVLLALGLTYTFASQSALNKASIGGLMGSGHHAPKELALPDSSKKQSETLSKKQIDEIKNRIDQASELLKSIKIDSSNFKTLEGLHESLSELLELTSLAQLSEQDHLQMEKDMALAELEMKEAEEEMRQAEVEMRVSEKEMQLAEEEMRKAEIVMEQELKRADEELRKADIEMKKADEELRKAEIELKKADKELANLDQMEKELKKDFSSTDIKSFYLNEKEFFVNGKKQSNEMHKRYAKKYLKQSKSICSNCTIENGKVTMHE